MGITISHKLGANRIHVKSILDKAERLAKEASQHIPLEIRRIDENKLLIDIEGCETLSFCFKNKAQIEAEKNEGWSYLYDSLTDRGKKEIDEGYKIADYPQNEKVYCSDFCKTQYAKTALAHKIVCDLIRTVAGHCFWADVNDEADYYYSGDIEEAKRTIEKSGAMINSIGAMLAGTFGDENIIKGGETIIKPIKK